MAVQTLDPQKRILVVGGIIITGFSDGDCISFKRSGKLYETRSGADGNVARIRNADKSGEITIKLLQTSEANQQLSELILIDNLLEDGVPTFPISFTDLSGTSIAFASSCWVSDIPEMIFGKAITERAWVFACHELTLFHGANQ